MEEISNIARSRLFEGISPEDRKAVLSCTGYHIGTFRKGEFVAFEAEHIRHIGIVLSGAVDMVKEDVWGNKTMLVRIEQGQLFGETFAWGEDSRAVVTFVVSADARILFIPFQRIMNIEPGRYVLRSVSKPKSTIC